MKCSFEISYISVPLVTLINKQFASVMADKYRKQVNNTRINNIEISVIDFIQK